MSSPSNPYQFQLDELDRRLSEAQAMLADSELKSLAETEIAQLTAQKQQLEQLATEYSDQTGETKAEATTQLTSCTLEIRPGAGGDEAKIWATDLQRMYARFAEILGLKLTYLDDLVIQIKGKVSDPEVIAGLVPAAASAPDDTEPGAQPSTEPSPELSQPPLPAVLYPFDIYKYESGVHRVQRVPSTEAQGRIHTSTASVVVLPEIPPAQINIREDELDWQFTRSGGAGGQNVNKVNTAVRLTHKPTGIQVSARQERTQAQNREIALGLLRSQLWEIEEEKRSAAIGAARSVIGRNMRAEKIRTYNFPQNRVTDHRIMHSWHNLETILAGNLTDVVATLQAELL